MIDDDSSKKSASATSVAEPTIAPTIKLVESGGAAFQAASMLEVSESVANLESQNGSESELKNGALPESNSNMENGSNPETKPESDSESKYGSNPETKLESDSESNSEFQLEPRNLSISALHGDSKPEPRADSDTTTKKNGPWIVGLRAPLFLFMAYVLLAPKVMVLWLLIVLVKPVASWLYGYFPATWKEKVKALEPAWLKRSRLLNEFAEGADQGLPFVLFWLYICCAPFALIWMGIHWTQALFRPESNKSRHKNDTLVFVQNRRSELDNSEDNFYSSRIFGVVFLLFFLLGIPSFFSYAVYEKLGINNILKDVPVTNSRNPRGFYYSPDHAAQSKLDEGKPDGKSPLGTDATVVTGYSGDWPELRNIGVEPKQNWVFFVHFYLVSVASALCVLFFRAWFIFPLNFASNEHDVEFSESGIRKKCMKSWFRSVLTLNGWAIGAGPDSLEWSEVKGLRSQEEGYARLWPLPETIFKKESLTYKLLNKVAAFIDGLSNKVNKGKYLVFSSTDKGSDFGTHIQINLNDLNCEQRARLFYSVKKWAPHVVVSSSAEEQLLGSVVLKDNRYTQLWFDMLTSRTQSRRQHMLLAGESLKNGEYSIEERISSGGQATTYLARNSSGAKCVLKEFILATTKSAGALLESAREFEAEVSLLSQLSHPGIVKLEDFFSEDGRVYVVLEHISGRSLRQKVQDEGLLPEKEVARIALAITEVLEYLHNCNPPIVHRDITPENILIQADGKVTLIDFSLAVKSDGRQPTESCAKQCFTPPEQFREEVSPQSDIYAMGATLYFLLTGSIPKPISRSSPNSKADVSAELNAIVERATELDLNQRYESVHWLKLDLAKLQET